MQPLVNLAHNLRVAARNPDFCTKITSGCINRWIALIGENEYLPPQSLTTFLYHGSSSVLGMLLFDLSLELSGPAVGSPGFPSQHHQAKAVGLRIIAPHVE